MAIIKFLLFHKKIDFLSLISLLEKHRYSGTSVLASIRSRQSSIWQISQKLSNNVSPPSVELFFTFSSNLLGRDKHYVSLFLARLSGENFLESDENIFLSQQSSSKCTVNTNMDWITCEFSIRNAMLLFNVQKFHVFRKPGSQRKYVRTTSFLKIPQSAAKMIDYIGGATSKLPSGKNLRKL
jgi:hypothetical protein